MSLFQFVGGHPWLDTNKKLLTEKDGASENIDVSSIFQRRIDRVTVKLAENDCSSIFGFFSMLKPILYSVFAHKLDALASLDQAGNCRRNSRVALELAAHDYHLTKI